MMAPRRASSPTWSDYEMDISTALTSNGRTAHADLDDETSDFEIDLVSASRKLKSNPGLLDTSAILDLDNSASDDEAIIKSAVSAANKKSSNVKGKSVKKGGGFQAMGLNAGLLKAITRKGYSVPTPIQRKTIPLLLEGLDVVGMARTGSGKTAAFVIPMIERLKMHSAKVGARAIIMSPSRELALQTLKVVKEFSKGTDLKCVLLVGGDSLEEQFGFMAGNPDIVIATPGRFLHLQVEMELDLKCVQYVVFDEADRLFEMGFSAQLTEILHALPQSRQTLLFSATLPRSLVEFAKAGLHDPSLVRLDADAKISTELESAFFTVKSADKEGALLQILQDIIKVPIASDNTANLKAEDKANNRKRKRTPNLPKNELASSFSTIIFVATKHHVEYLASLLTQAGYPVAYVYGTLDQVARRNQVDMFRSGAAQILVVTDVAARGIDIPILANVINYDFPPQPKVFVHRVGRTARAGRNGWSYSLLKTEDMPYLLDLQLFLGRKLVFGKEGDRMHKVDYNFAQDIIVGALKRDGLERCTEAATQLLGQNNDLGQLKEVAKKGEKLYQRTKVAASTESVKRAREILTSKLWMTTNPLFVDEIDSMEVEREKMLARVSGYRPTETVFEIGQRGLNRSEAAAVMRQRREKIKIGVRRNAVDDDIEMVDADDAEHTFASDDENAWEDDNETIGDNFEVDMSSADESDIASTFKKQITSKKPRLKTGSANTTAISNKRIKTNFQDSEHYMSYAPTTSSLAESRGYALANGTPSFAEAARTATLDLVADELGKSFAEPSKVKQSGVRWDAKSKKFVNRQNDEDGSKGGPKMIRGESGQKIASSFKSGRFDSWKKANKLSRLPRTGELETSIGGGFAAKSQNNGFNNGQRTSTRMFHKKVQAPKAADKGRDDYEIRKKRMKDAKDKGLWQKGYGKKMGTEIKSNTQIGKDRRVLEKKREKNARPSKQMKAKGRPKRK